MVGVRGCASFLNWGLREHAPASCCVNPGESGLRVYVCVCVGGWVTTVLVWLNCAEGGVLVMSSKTEGPGARWG